MRRNGKIYEMLNQFFANLIIFWSMNLLGNFFGTIMNELNFPLFFSFFFNFL